VNEVTAVIVGRKGSERIPNKVLQPFAGTTLLEHKIEQLQSCSWVDRIVVGSDCDNILSVAEKSNVQALRRPDYYCDERKASANEMIENMCSLFRTDIVLWAHCTNPLISSSTYDKAVQTYIEREKEGYNSLLSVDEVREHMWGEDRMPLNYNPWEGEHPLSKNLPTWYKQNGAIFMQRHADMKVNSYFFGKHPYLYVTPSEESIDINTWHDYQIAIAQYNELEKQNGNN